MFCRPVVTAPAVPRWDGSVRAGGWLPDFVRLGELERHLGDGVIEEIVARVNNQIISRSEFQHGKEELRKEAQQQDPAHCNQRHQRHQCKRPQHAGQSPERRRVHDDDWLFEKFKDSCHV